jgi:putative PEP-CTERM system histidine kinase
LISSSLLAFATALVSGILGLAVLFRKRQSVASLCFFTGMEALAAESAFGGISLAASQPEKVLHWQTLAFIASSLSLGSWLCFSLTYSRGNYRYFLYKWRLLLAAAFLLPLGFSIGFRRELLNSLPELESVRPSWFSFGHAATALNLFLLIGSVLILMNLEKTFRSAVGIMRWRIKFLVLGLGVIFGARIYALSQALLFAGQNLALSGIESGALLIGSALIAIAYLRRGFHQVGVYPSRALFGSSVTVILAGAYLFVVGVLAQFVALLGGLASFQSRAFLVLLGIAVLGVLFFSDRLRQRLRRFVGRHFKRPQHDLQKVWTLITQRMSSARDQAGLCAEAVKLISNTFEVLSVTLWLFDEQKERFALGASTFQSEDKTSSRWDADFAASGPAVRALSGLSDPFDLEEIEDEWAVTLQEASPTQFPNGGNRICVPLWAGSRYRGFAILADRVNGIVYTAEELDLLKCIGDQVAAGLVTFQLTEELMVSKEMEAFRTMSAFFVHDLKNAASSLDLILQNLPVHFEDPGFREDSLRGISTTVNRINQLISRLSVLRHKLDLKPVESDLNELVAEALEGVTFVPGVQLEKELHPLPNVFGDREQLQNVVTNLLLNARDVVGTVGRIRVETTQRNDRAILSVADNGSGMSPGFLRNSLFRPFCTTKKKGLGIGLFQSKMIVEAHRGSIQVESEPGKGTTFRVILPFRPQIS